MAWRRRPRRPRQPLPRAAGRRGDPPPGRRRALEGPLLRAARRGGGRGVLGARAGRRARPRPRSGEAIPRRRGGLGDRASPPFRPARARGSASRTEATPAGSTSATSSSTARIDRIDVAPDGQRRRRARLQDRRQRHRRRQVRRQGDTPDPALHGRGQRDPRARASIGGLYQPLGATKRRSPATRAASARSDERLAASPGAAKRPSRSARTSRSSLERAAERARAAGRELQRGEIGRRPLGGNCPKYCTLPADLPARARDRRSPMTDGGDATGRAPHPAPPPNSGPRSRPATATSFSRPEPAPARRGCSSSATARRLARDGVEVGADARLHLHREGGGGASRPGARRAHRPGASGERAGDATLARELRTATPEPTERAGSRRSTAFCRRLLAAHPVAAGLDPRFRVLDEAEAARLARARLRRGAGGAAGARTRRSPARAAAYRTYRLGDDGPRRPRPAAQPGHGRAAAPRRARRPCDRSPREAADPDETARAPTSAEAEAATVARAALEALLEGFPTATSGPRRAARRSTSPTSSSRALELLRERRRSPRGMARPVRPPARRRVPGHQPRPARSGRAAAGPQTRTLLRRRRAPVDLPRSATPTWRSSASAAPSAVDDRRDRDVGAARELPLAPGATRPRSTRRERRCWIASPPLTWGRESPATARPPARWSCC